MTRKHFEMVAQTVSLIKCPIARKEVARDWVGMLRQFNPRFDSKRFFAACGVAA